MSDSFSLATYLSSYKPIPSSVPDWDEQKQATWPATTATLVTAGQEAVLVDALMTVTEGEQLASWIRPSHPGRYLRHPRSRRSLLRSDQRSASLSGRPAGQPAGDRRRS